MRVTQVNKSPAHLPLLVFPLGIFWVGSCPCPCPYPCPLLLNHLSTSTTTISTTFSLSSASGKVKEALLKGFHIGHAQQASANDESSAQHRLPRYSFMDQQRRE
jgi:hypothetical protein